MAWIAAIASLAAGALSASSKGRETKKEPQDIISAYGERNTPQAGAIASRDFIFDRINRPGFRQGLDESSQRYTSALEAAGSDPRFDQIADFGSATLRGDFLQSPVVQRYADQAGQGILAAGADREARTRADFGRAGLGFSSGILQALQASRAASAANANRVRSGILADNYGRERTLQQNAPSILTSGITSPVDIMGAVPNSRFAGLGPLAGLTTQLLANQSVVDPTLIQQPSLSDRLAAGVQTGTSVYDLINSFRKN